MASKVIRLCTTFLGGGSVLLGVGFIHHRFKNSRKSNRSLFNNSLCEPQSNPNDINNNSSETSWKIHNAANVFNQNKSDNEIIIEKARSLIKRFKEEIGSPGLAISVSVNGKTVWSEGFGYSDVENDVECTPNTVMRIASISKPLTATAASMGLKNIIIIILSSETIR